MASLRKKYIITGAPGTGKTTLISRLKEEMPCMDEVSRKVIVKEQEQGKDGMPWENLERFTDLVYTRFVKTLKEQPDSVFCDRSVLDLIAYLKVVNKPIPKELDEFPYSETFNKTVFFAPTWREIYRQDEQRLQEFDYCLKLEEALLEEYSKRGFNIIKLPKCMVDNRLSFIKKSVSLP